MPPAVKLMLQIKGEKQKPGLVRNVPGPKRPPPPPPPPPRPPTPLPQATLQPSAEASDGAPAPLPPTQQQLELKDAQPPISAPQTHRQGIRQRSRSRRLRRPRRPRPREPAPQGVVEVSLSSEDELEQDASSDPSGCESDGSTASGRSAGGKSTTRSCVADKPRDDFPVGKTDAAGKLSSAVGEGLHDCEAAQPLGVASHAVEAAQKPGAMHMHEGTENVGV